MALRARLVEGSIQVFFLLFQKQSFARLFTIFAYSFFSNKLLSSSLTCSNRSKSSKFSKKNKFMLLSLLMNRLLLMMSLWLVSSLITAITTIKLQIFEHLHVFMPVRSKELIFFFSLFYFTPFYVIHNNLFVAFRAHTRVDWSQHGVISSVYIFYFRAHICVVLLSSPRARTYMCVQKRDQQKIKSDCNINTNPNDDNDKVGRWYLSS